MGYALAEAFADEGASVTLVSGPTAQSTGDSSIKIIHVTTAAQMLKACRDTIKKADIVVFAAAVADFTPESYSRDKIRRGKDEVKIELKPTVDIAGELGKDKQPHQFFAGFALESDKGVESAVSKLHRKNLDMIVLNSLTDPGAGFGTDTNKISIIDKSGNIDTFELKHKRDVAFDIVWKIIKTSGHA